MSNQLQVTGAAKIRNIQGPVVANSGVISALNGAASQYVRGDGTLADFPTSTGGGSSVSYYLNSSVSQGTIGGVAYRQLSKVPISGAGTDITASSNGYIASYLTDANDPSLLEVPAGNFNCEFYFSVNSNAHNPYVYAELYKYDGTTFTLLGSNQAIPEYLTNGTTLSAYYFAIPVAIAALNITDRLAIRIYVNVDGRTVTLHTENNHLCQVVTTFSKGLISLNSLTRQNQFFQTGTSGSDFNISSSTATHTFNIPDASASARGLITTGIQTIAGNKTFSGLNIFTENLKLDGNGSNAGTLLLKNNTTFPVAAGYSAINSNANIINLTTFVSASKTASLDLSSLSDNIPRTFTFPNASGTIALTSNLSSYVPYTGATTNVNLGNNSLSLGTAGTAGSSITLSGTLNDYIVAATVGCQLRLLPDRLKLIDNQFGGSLSLYFRATGLNTGIDRLIALPNADGTVALTSDIPSLAGYAPYTGATTNVNLGAFGITASGLVVSNNSTFNSNLLIKKVGLEVTTPTYVTQFAASSGVGIGYSDGTGGANFILQTAAIYDYTYPAATGTLALLESTQTFSGDITFSNDLLVDGVRVGNGSGGSNNARFGALSYMSNTTGSYNTAIGTYTLNANTTGSYNTALGNSALYNNTTASNNTAIGGNALANNTTSSNNTAVGFVSLGQNTIGTQNSALGSNSLTLNTIGSNNIAIGYTSLNANTTGSQNTSIGVAALSLHTTGTYNTAIGYGAGGSITTGSNNTIVGYYVGTATMSNNIVLADGAGNVKYQWDGSSNNFDGILKSSGALWVNTSAGSPNSMIILAQVAGTQPPTLGNSSIGVNTTDFRFTATTTSTNFKSFSFSTSTLTNNSVRTYSMPDASGTLALTSDISGYLPLTGGTLTGGLYINPTNTGVVGLDVASNTTRFRSDNLEGFKRQLEITMGSGTLVQMVAKGFGGNYGTDMAFYTATTSGVNGTPAMYITGTNNRIGVKTGTPSYDLDVNGSGRFVGTLTAGLSNGNIRLTGSSDGFVGSGASDDTLYLTDWVTGAKGLKISLSTGASKFTSRLTINGPNDDTDIALQVQAPTGSGKYIMFGRNGAGSAVMAISAEGLLSAVTGVFTASKAGEVVQINNTRNNASGDYGMVTSLGANANNTSSYHYIAATGGADKFYVYGNGTILTLSDKRLKKNINKVTDTYLDKVLGLNIVTYNWNDQQDGSALEFGMIAQEVEECIPDIVNESRKQKDGEIYKGIQVSVLPYILIKAIQEQQYQIDELKTQIQTLLSK